MTHSIELVWLACALAFIGSFGLGWTVEEVFRQARARKIPLDKDEQ